MFVKSDARQSKLFAGLAAVAALGLLTACSTEGTTEEPPADQEVEQQTVEPEATPEDTTATDDATTDDAANDDQASSEDPVFEIIDIVEAEYADGFIVDIDREDSSTQFDVDVVVGNELYELEVNTDGTVNVDDRDDDDDKVQKANQATVTVTEALNQAFESHPDATFDQVELDDDDGSLDWEVDLDGPAGEDIDVNIAAN